MCGIAGWNLTERPSLEFVLTLAAQIEERGRDSFGFFNGETKEVYKGDGAITAKMQASRLQFTNGFFHTRHATTGAKTVENSHPYQIGDILGAHNGVLHNHREINWKYKRNFDVDSMHIFAHISEGLDTSELEGYGAIEYIRDGKYFVAACNHGALEVALTDKGVIWASTTESLDAAIFQAGYTLIQYYRIDNGKVYHIEADAMYDTEHTFKMKEHSYAPIYKESKTGIRTYSGAFGSTSNMSEWEKDLEKEEREYERGLFADDKPFGTTDVCHWCSEYKEVWSMTDGTVACVECAEYLAEMEDEDEEDEDGEKQYAPEGIANAETKTDTIN